MQCRGRQQSIKDLTGLQAAKLQQEITEQRHTMQILVQAHDVQVAEISRQQDQLKHQVSYPCSPIHSVKAL